MTRTFASLGEARREIAKARRTVGPLRIRAFCPTGEGGGIDNSCGRGGGGSSDLRAGMTEAEAKSAFESRRARADELKAKGRELEQAALGEPDTNVARDLSREARRLERGADKLSSEMLTARYVGFAADQEGYLAARSAAEDAKDAHHARKESLLREIEAGVPVVVDKYADGKYHHRHAISISDVANAGAYGKDENRLAEAQAKYPGLTAEQHAAARELADRDFDTAYDNGHKNAYYGEPSELSSRDVDVSGRVAPEVAAGVRQGGASPDIRRFMANAEVAIQVKDKVLSRIISSGEMKNRFEGGVHGVGKGNRDYADSRKGGEERALGIRPDAAPSERPVYGYLEHPDRMLSSGASMGDNYGGVQIVLRDSVKDRTSYTVGDSLDDRHLGGYSGAVNNPTSHDGVASVGYFSDPAAAERWPVTATAGHSAADWRVMRASRANSEAEEAPRAPSYIEAQVFGKIRLEDIREIRVPRGSVELKPAQFKKLGKAGVSVREVSPRHPYSHGREWDFAKED